MVEPPDNSIASTSVSSSPPTGEGIILDIGTGDGHFVYRSARRNPRKFYIGIDANARPLEKISEKIHRKPEKGGLPNVLFVQAAVEDLPAELEGMADEIHVHFPWGSLLHAVATGDSVVLRNIRRICAPAALLEVVIGLDLHRDSSEIERLKIGEFDTEYVKSVLVSRYRSAGFEITESNVLRLSEWVCLQTSWAKRLSQNPRRRVTYLIARAV